MLYLESLLVHCCLGMQSLLSPGWLVFDKVDIPSNFGTPWYGLCWSIPENQKIGLMPLLLVRVFWTLVPYQGPGAHMIFSGDNNWWKYAIAVLFLHTPPLPSKYLLAQPSSVFTESKNRLVLRLVMCWKQWVIDSLTAGSKPCMSKVQFQGWKFQNSLFELADQIFLCVCLQTAVWS